MEAFRQGEWSLSAKKHVKIISFFYRPWQPSPFQLFKSNFLGTYWSDSSSFCTNITTDSRSIIIGRRIFFRRVIADKYFNFQIIKRANCIILSPVFIMGLEMLMFLHKLMKHFQTEWRVIIVFAKNFFRPFFVKRIAEDFELFRNRFNIPHCPLLFLTLTLFFSKNLCGIPLLNP